MTYCITALDQHISDKGQKGAMDYLVANQRARREKETRNKNLRRDVFLCATAGLFGIVMTCLFFFNF